MFKLKSNMVLLTVFMASRCFAMETDDNYVSPDVQKLTNFGYTRCKKYIENKSTVEKYSKETMLINTALAHKDNVDTKRHATNAEKKALFQRVMEAELIHYEHPHANPNCYDESLINYNGTDAKQLLLKDHFTILKAVKEFSYLISIAYHNSRDQFQNTIDNNWDHYWQIQLLSGVNQETFARWFTEVVNVHIEETGNIQKRNDMYADRNINAIRNINELNQGCSKILKTSTYNSWHTLFGDVEHFFGFNFCRVVFVGQYNSPSLNDSVLVRLPDVDGRQRFIVIQNPLCDAGSNYSLRVHATMHSPSPGGDESTTVSIHVKAGDGISLDDDNAEVISHENQDTADGSKRPFFSPDNMHLVGLHQDALRDDEFYSFVSELRWGGQAIDTFHLLLGDTPNLLPLATSVNTFGDFVRKLNQAYILGQPNFKQHLEKMIKFANGTL